MSGRTGYFVTCLREIADPTDWRPPRLSVRRTHDEGAADSCEREQCSDEGALLVRCHLDFSADLGSALPHG
jgi:hypothetical protein